MISILATISIGGGSRALMLKMTLFPTSIAGSLLFTIAIGRDAPFATYFPILIVLINYFRIFMTNFNFIS